MIKKAIQLNTEYLPLIMKLRLEHCVLVAGLVGETVTSLLDQTCRPIWPGTLLVIAFIAVLQWACK